MLLLDEPLGALDLKLRQAMQIELKEIQQQVGLTFIYVTHDQEEALTMSDRLAVFNHGKVEQVGTPAEVYERPATGFVAGFVGISNVLEGEAADGDRRRPARVHDPSREDRDGASRTPRSPTAPAPATGHVREVVYLGALTRYIVTLDVGGELVVMQQNLAHVVDGGAPGARQGRASGVGSQEQPSGRSGRRFDGGVRGPGRRMLMSKVRTWFVVLAVLALVAAACGDDDDRRAARRGGAIEPSKTYTTIGETEGELELIAWHGYVEDGTTEGGEDYDWVTPFEDETGCQVNVTYGDTSDEMVTLMRQGGGTVYDGVSASGDASNRLIAGGDVGAIDPSLFPEFANVIAPLNPDGGTNNRALRRRRERVRDPVHVRAELPDVQHRRGHARPRRAGT